MYFRGSAGQLLLLLRPGHAASSIRVDFFSRGFGESGDARAEPRLASRRMGWKRCIFGGAGRQETMELGDEGRLEWPGGMRVGVVFYKCFLSFEFRQGARWAAGWVQRVYRPPVWAI
jgi:hypothetical protein